MHQRHLALALAAILLPLSAHAEDLLQTYRIARTADPQLQASEANMRASKEGVVQARSYFLPQVTGTGRASSSLSYSSGGTTTVINPVTGLPQTYTGNSHVTTHSVSGSVGASQMIFDRGVGANYEAAAARAKAGESNYEAASGALITRTSQAYFNVLVAMETLSAAQAQENALKKQFDFASKRLEVGLAPITDVHEARAQYDASRANSILQQNQLEDAYQALAEITGQPIRTLMALPDDFRPALPPEGGVDDWVKRATDGNPVLQTYRYNIEAAEKGISAARAAFLPTVYGSGSVGASKSWSDRGNGMASNGWNHGPSLGVDLRIPIFTGGRTASQVRSAIAQRDLAQDQFEQQRRAIDRNTRSAYNSMVAGVSAVEARRLALVAAQSAYDASLVGLEVGTRTVIDVLINQQNLFSAQQAYSLAKYNFLQSQLTLRQAAGTLDVADVEAVNRLLTVPAGQVPKVTAKADAPASASTADTSSSTKTAAPKKTKKKAKRRGR